MEAVSSCETSVTVYRTTWSNISEDNRLHIRRREILKSHLVMIMIMMTTMTMCTKARTLSYRVTWLQESNISQTVCVLNELLTHMHWRLLDKQICFQKQIKIKFVKHQNSTSKQCDYWGSQEFGFTVNLRNTNANTFNRLVHRLARNLTEVRLCVRVLHILSLG
jgi:hypothetical protein